MTVCCWMALAAFKMALLALCTDAAGMTVALTVVLLASLRLITWEPAVLTAETGRNAVATGLIVICLVISIEGPPVVATTVVGREDLVCDEKIALVVAMTDVPFSPFFKPSGSNSGSTRVTVRLICPDEVLIVLILTFGITGAVSVFEAGEPLLLLSLVTLEGLSGCFVGCSCGVSGTLGFSLTCTGSFCVEEESKAAKSSPLTLLALRAAIAAIQDESFVEDLALVSGIADALPSPDDCPPSLLPLLLDLGIVSTSFPLCKVG